MADFLFKPLDKSIDKVSFDCGVPELNDYFKKYARQNDEKGLAKTFVVIDSTNSTIPLGYYTLSTAQIGIDEIPDDLKKKLPKYPLPCVRIGRLGVDTKSKGQGLGKLLLMNAFENILQVANQIGIYAVLVDAKDQGIKHFYSKFGFVELKSSKMSMIVPLTTVAQAFQPQDYSLGRRVIEG